VGNEYPGYSKAQPETQYTYYGGIPPEPNSNVSEVTYVPGQKWMNIAAVEQGRYPWLRSKFVPTPCMHCQEAPCVAASTGGAVYTRPDGVVIIDPVKAVGQSQIVDACPYGVAYWNNDESLPQKCTMCAHLIDEGKNPKCVDACPISDAIRFGDLDDPMSDVSQLVASGKAKQLHPEWGTQPKVFYIGEPTPTVAGQLMDRATKLDVTGATVALSSLRTGETMVTQSDLAGNFGFEDLDQGSLYMVRVEMPGYYSRIHLAYTGKDGFTHLGRVKLFPR